MNFLDTLLYTHNSTTELLESRVGQSLQIKIEHQKEIFEEKDSIILRDSILYFSNTNYPVCYCSCKINRGNLSSKEYNELLGGTIPIGKIFSFQNKSTIHKKNIIVEKVTDKEIAKKLGLRDTCLFQKTYELYEKDRSIGYISEFFNEESLNKLNVKIPFFNFIGNFNTLSDEKHEVTYNDLNDFLNPITSLLSSEIGNSFAFKSLGNNIIDILILLGFLNNQGNLVLSPGLQTAIPGFCEKIIICDPNTSPDINSISFEKNVNFTKGIDAEDNIILKTSGSTNFPKLVLHLGETLIKNAQSCLHRFRITSEDRILIPVPVYHMYGLGAALLPGLIAGASIRLVSNTNYIKLVETIRTFKPTVTFLTSGICEMFLIKEFVENSHRLFVSAGDKIKKDTFLQFEKKYGKLINLYGTTELGAIATSDLDADLEERSQGILALMPKVSINPNLSPNEKKSFCFHPYGFKGYYTSDATLSSVDQTGFEIEDVIEKVDNHKIKVIDRIGNSVNRNGVLVTLSEIEFLVEQIVPEVEKIIVVIGDDVNIIGKKLVGLCQLREGKDITTQEIRKKCFTGIKRHLIPDEFFTISKFPKLPNGKIDRVTLKNNLNAYSEI